jgi:hypothetical protein
MLTACHRVVNKNKMAAKKKAKKKVAKKRA